MSWQKDKLLVSLFVAARSTGINTKAINSTGTSVPPVFDQHSTIQIHFIKSS